jgi:hypothetical protein
VDSAGNVVAVVLTTVGARDACPSSGRPPAHAAIDMARTSVTTHHFRDFRTAEVWLTAPSVTGDLTQKNGAAAHLKRLTGKTWMAHHAADRADEPGTRGYRAVSEALALKLRLAMLPHLMIEQR